MRHANGISSPWTTGEEPARALADNPRLSGTATWTGGLVGFTSELRSVGGNAELSVELATMDGSAAFTELQSGSTGSAPGALGTGVTWNNGNLRYTIAVDANYLRSTGGCGHRQRPVLRGGPRGRCQESRARRPHRRLWRSERSVTGGGELTRVH